MNDLLEILLVFGRLGLLGFGAAFSVLPEMSRQLVDVHAWLSHAEFTDGYALGQLAPGPNMLAVFFYGYQIKGVPGALAAGMGMFGPPLLLAMTIARAWTSLNHLPWVLSIQRALLPIGAGLMAGGVLTLGKSAIHDWLGFTIGVWSVLLMYRFHVNPAIVVLAGGFIGIAWATFTLMP